MKTNFTKQNHIVLTNNENKIIAIIKCETGAQNITEKLIQAISEDYDANSVDIINEENTCLNDYDYEYDFKASYLLDGDRFSENFTMTFTNIY